MAPPWYPEQHSSHQITTSQIYISAPQACHSSKSHDPICSAQFSLFDLSLGDRTYPFLHQCICAWGSASPCICRQIQRSCTLQPTRRIEDHLSIHLKSSLLQRQSQSHLFWCQTWSPPRHSGCRTLLLGFYDCAVPATFILQRGKSSIWAWSKPHLQVLTLFDHHQLDWNSAPLSQTGQTFQSFN